MSAETDLQTLLLANPTVAGLVGTRISADRAEQGSARPFVVYARVASQPFTALNGAHLRTQANLDVQCWANTRLAAESLGDAVAAAVRGVTSQTVVGRSAVFDAEADAFGCVLNVNWWE
jgi:hypothetical protein